MHRAESKSLADAAEQSAKSLPKGGIVTGEFAENQTAYSVAGNPGVADVPPEKILFEIGSLTKVFTGLLLAQAVVDGKVKLDTTLQECLGSSPALSDPNVGRITLRQLATHTSGLPRLPLNLDAGSNPLNPYAHFDRELLDAAIASQKLAHAPPFPNAYSNFGVGLLGDVLARIYGQPWEELIREKITQPLGLPDTVVTLNEEQTRRLAPPFSGSAPAHSWQLGALQGAGALHSTAQDLLRFGRAILQPESTPLREAIQLMLTPQTEDGRIGLGIMRSRLFGEPDFEHSGSTGGYAGGLFVLPDRAKALVILINNNALSESTVIAATRSVDAEPVPGEPLPPEALREFAGVYAIDSHIRFTLIEHKGQLMARLTGQPFLPVFPHQTKDRFFYRKVPAELQFERRNGKITALTLFQNGRETRAVRTEEAAPSVQFLSDKDLAAYVGDYALPGSHFTVVVRENTLFVKLNEQAFAPVFSTKADQFAYDVVTAVIEFDRDASGSAQTLRLYQNGQIVSAPRVKPAPTPRANEAGGNR